MGNLYKKFTKTDIQNREGGYKPRLLFAPLDSFLTCALPTPNTPPALGDDYKIISDHTFGSTDGWIGMLGKIDSATAKTTSDADGVDTHTIEIEIEGDSPELRSQLKLLKNPYSQNIFLLKDANCLQAVAYNQYGDSCLTPTIKVEFDAKTTAAGTKVHKITATIREHMYFYSGTVTEKPVSLPLSCPLVFFSATATSITGTILDTAASYYICKIYSNSAGTTQVGSTVTLSPNNHTITFSALTASTPYYVKIIPVAIDGTQLTTCALIPTATTA